MVVACLPYGLFPSPLELPAPWERWCLHRAALPQSEWGVWGPCSRRRRGTGQEELGVRSPWGPRSPGCARSLQVQLLPA